jgi:hypothetical protein
MSSEEQEAKKSSMITLEAPQLSDPVTYSKYLNPIKVLGPL